MDEVRESVFARAVGIDRHLMAIRIRPVVIRNSRILIGLALAGGVAAFPTSIGLGVMCCLNIFTEPAGRNTLDRFAVAALCALGAWLMAATCVYLWRLGDIMAYCAVRLDSYGAHFRLDSVRDSKETFIAWEDISAVRYKHIAGEQKVTIQGTGDVSAVFTSNLFYRPRKIAQLIASRAGLPVMRG